MKYFTLNGKEYKSKELDYNTACDLEDMGVSLEMANTRPMSMVRAYFACCADISKEAAGKERRSEKRDTEKERSDRERAEED